MAFGPRLELVANPTRNETQKRNWPEYLTDSVRNNKEDLLVYISNSQAVGTEIRDSSAIYPSFVRSKMAQSNPNVRMENWSVSGLTAEHIELLVLQAQQRNAKYLVLAVSMLNFDSLRNYRFNTDSTDINLLVGKPSFWLALTDTFIGQYVDWDAKISRLFHLYSQAFRAKIYAFDLAAEKIERKWHQPLFGHVRTRDALKSIKQLAPESAAEIEVEAFRLTNRMTTSMWRKSFQISNEPRLKAVYSKLRTRLKKSGIKLVWIWVPVGRNADNLEAVSGQQEIVDTHCQGVRLDGWICEDLSQALEQSLFIPSIFSSHLTLEGHRALARIISPILQRAIY